MVLVAHQAIYGLDQGGGWLGLLYNRRTEHDAAPAETAAHAFRAALSACLKLEQEPEFSDTLRFDGSACEVVVNDRARAANDAAGNARLQAVLKPLLDRLWGADSYTTAPLGEARDRLGITARCVDTHSVRSLADRL